MRHELFWTPKNYDKLKQMHSQSRAKGLSFMEWVYANESQLINDGLVSREKNKIGRPASVAGMCVTISARVPVPIVTRLNEHCGKHSATLSAIVSKALDRYLGE